MKWINFTQPKPHYYLEYIGVEPEYQGKGVGSAILKHLMRKADEAGGGLLSGKC